MKPDHSLPWQHNLNQMPMQQEIWALLQGRHVVPVTVYLSVLGQVWWWEVPLPVHPQKVLAWCPKVTQ